jgi:16S rRNA (cytidine1402-2'-O)-methyltransferase
MIIIQKTFTQKKAILYLVSTPIGNMLDFSFRALETLKKVDYILAEDTRKTKKILDFYNFTNKLISLHKYNEKKRLKKILSFLEENKNLALVSNAGTPLISDPGLTIVQKVKEEGFFVTAIPGASAFLTAFSVSSLTIPFCFLGFLPKKKKQKLELLLKYITFEGTLIFYESALRIQKTLFLINEHFPDSIISLSRELTKKFETIINGNIDMILKEKLSLKGEYVLLIQNNQKINFYKNLSLDDHIMFLLKKGLKEKEAFSQIAKERKISKKKIYKKYKIINKNFFKKKD